MTLNTGDKAPDFTLPGDDGREISLGDYQGRKLILYFYPKDDTPGCTAQACGFRDHIGALGKLGVDVIGISKDSIQKHAKFKAKYGLNFPLLSDENSDICERYGVWKEKSMYGKTYMGIERSTFLIDESGAIAAIWRKVKVAEHIGDIRNTLSALK